MAQNNDINNKSNELNYFGIVSSLLYISIIVAFGVPLWWTTTSPSRHSLPDISSLLVSSQRIVHKFPVCVVTIDNEINREELKSELVNNWPQRISAEGSLAYVYEWKVRPLLQKEKLIFDSHQNLLDIDNHFNSVEGHDTKGKLWIFVLQNDSSLLKENFAFGRHRFVYIKNDEKSFADKTIAETIVELVESTQVLSDKSYNSQKTDFLLNPEIDLIINIIDENEELNDVLINKIDEIHRIGDIGLIGQSGVSELIKFNLISQILHYTLNDNLISSRLSNDSNNERLFDISHVPVLMNTVESRVVEHNNKQSYHILVFIPSSKPLLFYDTKLKTKSNSIMTPYRGGILVWNKPNDFVNGFRALVRNLIGLPQTLSTNLLKKDLFFNKWELDAIRRSVTQKQLLRTLASLESISKLIEKVGNIVILEEIANRMHTAVDLSHDSIHCLANSDLDNAFKLSTKAYLSSETAFFDPSLLSLLYFPEDQKYAVYFPLFLPVSLPLISSIYYLFRTFKSRK
jgi:phosphatidylinositol glycan class S